MSSTTGLLLLLLLLAVSLTTVSIVNQWQTRNRMIQHKIQQIRWRIAELEEVCMGIEPLLESNSIPGLINEEVLDLIESVNKLDSSPDYLTGSLDNAQQLSHQFSQQKRIHPFSRVLPSDASLARHQYFLEEAARLVRRHHALGRLQSTELEAFIQQLAWARLMIKVVTCIAHGHQAQVKNDFSTAYGYYRNAQNLLIVDMNPDDRRQRLIRELSDIMADRRKVISKDLIPEALSLSSSTTPHQSSSS